jgi:hypothetical protein
MTQRSDGITAGLDEAAAHFVTLDTYKILQDGLGTAPSASTAVITFSDLWQAAENPDKNRHLIATIQADKTQAARFAALLRSLAAFSQPAQSAAATDNVEKRVGTDFDLELKPSSRQDGAYFLIIRIHKQTEITPQHLYYCHNNSYNFTVLSAVHNGISQVMISEANPLIDAFNDPTAEFFIK